MDYRVIYPFKWVRNYGIGEIFNESIPDLITKLLTENCIENAVLPEREIAWTSNNKPFNAIAWFVETASERAATTIE